MLKNPKVVIFRTQFDLLRERIDKDEVIYSVEVNDDLPHLEGNVDRGLIEVELVPTGAVLQDRLKKSK